MAALSAALVASTAPVVAQQSIDPGSVSGRITDASGGGARVRLQERENNMFFSRAIAVCLALASVLSLTPLRGEQSSIPRPAALDVAGRSDATPWVAARGRFVAVAWGATIPSGKTDVFLAVSRDGGATFGQPVQVNSVAGEARLGGELPPRVALVAAKGMQQPDIVVLWTARGGSTEIKAARSRDGGKSFERSVALQSAGAAGDRGWPSLALDPRGRAHAIWLDHRGLAADKKAGTAHADHGKSGGDGVAMAQKSALYYATVGVAPREQRVAPGVCYCCKTAMAVDDAGVVYTAWRHVYAGNMRDMAFAVSRDAGRSFSTPVRVNEDGWSISGCPDDGPALAASGGNVHMIWPTVLNQGTPQGALFYTSTRDGRTFAPRVRIPTLGGLRPAHPQIAASKGKVFVAWDEGMNGQRLAVVRELKTAANGTGTFGEPIVLGGSGPASYPVLAATDAGFLAVWTAGSDPSRIETRLIR